MKKISPQSQAHHLQVTRQGIGRIVQHWSLLCLLVFATAGCSLSSKVDSKALSDTNSGTDTAFPSTEPWVFAGVKGRSIRTANYRIHTTSANEELVACLPVFYKAETEIYTSYGRLDQQEKSVAATHPSDDSEQVMDVYFFGSRREWELFSQDLLGDRARRYVQIGRGGFSTRGSSIIYDLGFDDSLKIAAHEGWHQFVQRNFIESIPVWLDEGIAAQMEGMTRDDAIDQNEEDESGAGGRGRGGGVVFQPEANTDRLGQLHEALAADRLPDLATLLATRPNSLLGDSDELVLDYYAQVWAFSRFLAEFDNGRYAQRLALLLRDARHGQMKARVEATLVKNGLPIEQESTGLMNPTAVFRVYFAANLDVVDAQFGEFKSQLAAQWESVLQQTGQRRNSGRHPRKWRGQYAK